MFMEPEIINQKMLKTEHKLELKRFFTSAFSFLLQIPLALFILLSFGFGSDGGLLIFAMIIGLTLFFWSFKIMREAKESPSLPRLFFILSTIMWIIDIVIIILIENL